MKKLKIRITEYHPTGYLAYLNDGEIDFGIRIAGGKSFSKKKTCLRAAQNLEEAAKKFRDMANK